MTGPSQAPTCSPQVVPPIRLTISSSVMPYGARNAAIRSPSTGSGSTRSASSATSGNPVLRSVKAKCSREYCILTTKLCASCPRPAGHARQQSATVKIDAHRQQIRAHRCRRGHAQAAHQIALADTPPPLTWVVIIQDVRRPGPPADARPAADLDPDARAGLDVLDPVGVPPALGYQPEGLP